MIDRARWAAPVVATLLAIACARATAVPDAPPASPFDALSAAELTAVVRIVRGAPGLPDDARFASVALDEPSKDSVLRGLAVPRVARAIVYAPRANRTFEGRVDVGAQRLLDWHAVPGAQPPLSGEDVVEAAEIVRDDPRWRAALARRGLDAADPRVFTLPWSAGYFGEADQDARLVRVVPYLREGAADDPFARPVEGVVATVDLTGRRVRAVDDAGAVPAAPPEPLAPTPDLGAPPSLGTAGGASIAGGAVRWGPWRFHVATHPREGVVLHQVAYGPDGAARPVLYRASVSEMVVPYGDPAPAWRFRNAFDVGELGLGVALTPLRAGVDVPAGARLLDAVFADGAGRPAPRAGVVAVYERDGGVAWKHGPTARRARELVVEWVATLGNYDYGFAWIFREDGAIEQRATLTGVMAAKGIAPGDAPDPHAPRVAPMVAAPHHQHFFAYRLDLDVAGAAHNRIEEVDGAAGAAGAANPHGNAIVARGRPLATELAARRQTDAAAGRRWLVVNDSAPNALGGRAAYALMPSTNVAPLAAPGSWVRRRAGFLEAQLWVTPYRAGEWYAAGDYPNQSRGGDGLPRWTAADRSLVNEDLVLWYVLGITHLPRPEDWPVMPSQQVGFTLLPVGFFGRNPLVRTPGR